MVLDLTWLSSKFIESPEKLLGKYKPICETGYRDQYAGCFYDLRGF